MLCSQFHAASFQPEHICFPIASAKSGPREKKKTLQMALLDQNQDLLVDGSVQDLITLRRDIQTRAVQAAIGAREPNRIISTIPPDVDEEEVEQSKGERTTLAQLRSGFGSGRNSFCPEPGQVIRPYAPATDKRNTHHSTSSKARNIIRN